MRSFLLLFLLPASAIAASPPGINDECDAAVDLVVFAICTPTTGFWTAATGSLPPVSCGGSTSSTANDVWYAFTATSNSTIVEVASGTDNDAVVEVFTGGCTTLSSITCADATLIGGVENIVLPTTIGVLYHVRVYWWEYPVAPTDLSFTICFYEGPAAPENNLCGPVVPQLLVVGSPLTFTGTTLGADTVGDYAPGSSLYGSQPSVWHAFTLGECAQVTIAYCGTSPDFESVWNLLSVACPADSLVYASTFDLLACGDGNATLHFDSVAAGTYYLPVLFDADDANGPYTIEATANNCTVGIAEMEQAGPWSLIVADGALSVHFPERTTEALIELLAVDGRSLWSGNLRAGGDGWARLDLPTRYGPGVLLVRVTTPQRSISKRVLMP